MIHNDTMLYSLISALSTHHQRIHREESCKHGACMGLHQVLCIYVMAIILVFCGTPNSMSWSVSNSFACSWDFFYLLGCPNMRAFSWYYYILLCQVCFSVGGPLLSEEKWMVVDVGEKGIRSGTWGNCNQDVVYERRICFRFLKRYF